MWCLGRGTHAAVAVALMLCQINCSDDTDDDPDDAADADDDDAGADDSDGDFLC